MKDIVFTVEEKSGRLNLRLDMLIALIVIYFNKVHVTPFYVSMQ
jgi:hypothetical protein